MRRSVLFLVPLTVLLAACADKRGDCIDEALKDVRVLETLIEETETNIARGYATQAEPTVKTGVSFCLSPSNPLGICTTTETEVKERPVAIDALAEQRKLRQLKQREGELRQKAQLEVMACEARFR
jgi:hypothetical protein